MSSVGEDAPPNPGEVDTPGEEKEAARMADQADLLPPPPPPPPHQQADVGDADDADDVFEDASDNGEVFMRRPGLPRPQMYPPPPFHHQPRPVVSTMPSIRPETYDGTSDWGEYLTYFEQLAELNQWDEERKAAVLSVCLKGEARVVLAGLDPARRRSFHALTTALAQSFAPAELVYLYQAELKARKRKSGESMAELGREIAKLVRLSHPTADQATREVIGINSFLEALPGPVSDMKLHVIKGRPRTLQEAVAHATEVDAVLEAESRKGGKRRGEVRRMATSSEEDSREEVERLKRGLEKMQTELTQTKYELAETKTELKRNGRRGERRSLKDVICYQCGDKGHYKRDCKKVLSDEQGNGPRRLDQ